MGDAKLIDSMIVDGLWDAFNHYHMGTTAENVAKKYEISRREQDEFAAASQQKAEAAQKAGRFKDEISSRNRLRARRPTVFDTRRIHPRRHDRRSAGRTQAGLRQGRHGHRRQCLGHQ